MSTYLDILDAVGAYYGTGSDQWVEIAKYGIHADNAAQIISQVPGANVVYNNAGAITGFTYNNPFSLGNGGAAGAINSNVQVATQAAGNTFQANIPATSAIDSQTGNLVMESGAKTISGGSIVSAVMDKISLGVMGVMTGCKLGAFIDSAIYNAAPDYWDRTLPEINPATWPSIAGTNELGQGFINALFGIDALTGQTQAYVPQDAFAYFAYMMAQQGFFASGGDDSASIADTTGLDSRVVAQMPIPCSNTFSFFGIYNSGWTGSTPKGPFELISGTGPIYFYTLRSTSQRPYDIYACSKSYFQLEIYFENDYGKYSENVTANSTSINGKSFYRATVRTSNELATPSSVPEILGHNLEYPYIILYGTITPAGSGKEGVELQPDASFPDTTGWNDPASVDTSLQTQYPDMYNNAIYIDVPQPDGTTDRIVYLPVPTTETTGLMEQSPTNTDVTFDADPVSPTDPDSLINTIIRYILDVISENPEDEPDMPQDDNPPDTGDGDTPVVVTPTGQASALWAVYNPSQGQIDSFGAWLWSSNFIDQVLKLFNNPMQAIIGLHKIFATPNISGTGNIVVGYLDSGVASNIVGAQYTDIDCGTVNVYEYFGNVFDYNETHIQLYLPFIGIVALDTADVMRSSINVVYHVDVITGACLAEVKVTRDASGGTLYQYAGDAAVRYPISSGSYMGVVSGILTAAGSVASAIMTGGATLPMAAGAIAGGIGSAHTNIQHSGNFSGNAGAMGAKKPYLIIERPQSYIAQGYEGYQGIGENAVRTVSQMAGYFKMTDVRLNSVAGAADEELEIIRAALESGVII